LQYLQHFVSIISITSFAIKILRNSTNKTLIRFGTFLGQKFKKQKMSISQESLKPEKFYHIYNHAIGSDSIFFNDDNYNYFLKKFTEYITPVAYTYAYCLMPNHFHFLIQIKSEKELFQFLKENDKLPDENITLASFKNLSQGVTEIDFFCLHLSRQFSNFFNGYSQALNKQQNRRGNLFIRSFKRKEISSKEYLKSLILYIHSNPVHHQFVSSISNWKYSSYHSLISDKATQLKREEAIELFEGVENFKFCHQQINQNLIEELESKILSV
jgi:REP element-mobilizing transposase RayT